MKAAGQVIQPGNVSILRDTGHSHEPTPPAGMVDIRSVVAVSCTVYSGPQVAVRQEDDPASPCETHNQSRARRGDSTIQELRLAAGSAGAGSDAGGHDANSG
jgi:hypothetical protein